MTSLCKNTCVERCTAFYMNTFLPNRCLSLQLFDPNVARYEVPKEALDLTSNPSSNSTMAHYSVSVEENPFAIKVDGIGGGTM